jgi:hypothetical protein
VIESRGGRTAPDRLRSFAAYQKVSFEVDREK